MKLVLETERIFKWLSTELLSWPVKNAYVFGSILDPENIQPNDVDLYVRYDKGAISEIVQRKNYIQKRFLVEFGIKLHLLLLTKQESENSKMLLKEIVSRSKKIVIK